MKYEKYFDDFKFVRLFFMNLTFSTLTNPRYLILFYCLNNQLCMVGKAYYM